MELKKLTDERLEDLLCKALEDRAGDMVSALAELQAYRKAVSTPVAWTDEVELRDLEKNESAYIFKANPVSPNADPRRVIYLYTAASPELTIPREIPASVYKVLYDECDGFVGCPAEPQNIWDACRAEILKGGAV